MRERRFRGRRVGYLSAWVVCHLIGARDEEWVPVAHTVASTRSEAIEAYGREGYERGRRAGWAACMMIGTVPYPHVSMGGQDRLRGEGGGDD